MKKLFSLCVLAVLLVSCGTSTTTSSKSVALKTKVVEEPTEFANSITSDELKEMLTIYASDEFEGRETGEKGQKLAVEYLKNQYVEMDIASPYGNDDYFQEVPLEKQKVAETQLSVNGQSFENAEDLIPLMASESIDTVFDEIVYVGYGIDADNYSDYRNIDVKGKMVLAKAGEPKDEEGNYVTSGDKDNTKWSNGRQSLSSKRDAAINNGAKGLLYFDEDLFSRYVRFYKRQINSGSALIDLSTRKICPFA